MMHKGIISYSTKVKLQMNHADKEELTAAMTTTKGVS
jgi:nicotinamide mononucleotide (NMN) deamidase PncC